MKNKSINMDMVYMNNAAMARLSDDVQQVGIQAIVNQFGQDTDSIIQSIRKDFSTIIGGNDERCISIMPSTAYAITFAVNNLVPQLLLAANQQVTGTAKIMVLQDQFCSAIYPWQEIISNSEGKLSFLVVPYPNETETWTDLIVQRLTSNSAIAAVCLPPLHWSDGGIIDLVTIGDLCYNKNIPLIVDATQAAGAIPIYVNKIRPTMLTCSVHKWLRAPSGVCLVYIDSSVHDTWVPLDHNDRGRDIGGPNWDAAKDTMTPTGYPTRYMSDARKFNSGGKPNPILLPMLSASLQQVVAMDIDSIQSKLKVLSKPLLEWVHSSSAFILPSSHSYHILGIRPRNDAMTSDQMIELCVRLQNDYGIYTAVRAGALRISPYVDNSIEDMTYLVHALAELTKV